MVPHAKLPFPRRAALQGCSSPQQDGLEKGAETGGVWQGMGAAQESSSRCEAENQRCPLAVVGWPLQM